MAKYTIYHSNGTKVCEVHKLTHQDSLMGETTVEVSIKSPTVIAFKLGDYLDYRGRRYYMAVTPTVQKQARVNTVGNAIVYDAVKLTTAAGYDMTRCEFRDVVLSAQTEVYHTNFAARAFNFYCTSLAKYGDRLQANLNRLFTGNDAWKVYVRTTSGTDVLCNGSVDDATVVGKKDVTVTVSGENCWDSLKHVKEDFDVNFMLTDKVVSGKNVKAIVLGASGTVVPYYFQYGKGKGVFKFERTTDDSQAVVTRMRAYGSQTNMPRAYYQSKGLDATINVKCLMLPDFGTEMLAAYVQWRWHNDSSFASVKNRLIAAVRGRYGVTADTWDEFSKYVQFSHDKNDPYIDAYLEQTRYGVHEGCVTFDGSGDYDDIHPSIEHIGNGYNQVVSATQMTDDGKGVEPSYVPEVETFEVVVNLPFNPASYIPFSANSFTVHFNDGMCGGRDFECTRVDAVNGVANQYKLTLKREEDSVLNLWFPYSGFNVSAGDEYVLTGVDMPDAYINLTAGNELLPAAVESLMDNCGVRYKYSLTVDNIEMQRQHEGAVAANKPNDSVYNTLKAGDELWFGDADLGFNFDADTQQVTGSVLIDKVEIKEEDGKIPQYDITLVDEVQVGTIENIQKQIDAITSGKTTISGGGYSNADIQNIMKALGDARYLKLTGGTVNGNVGINGNTTMDGNATVTGVLHATKLTMDSLEVMEAKHIQGKMISSPAGAIIKRVEETDNAWMCYFDGIDEDGNEVWPAFAPDDMIYCEQFDADEDGDTLTSKVYWRQCVTCGRDAESGMNYVKISKTNGSAVYADTPEVGDNIVTLGNLSDDNRQGAMIQSPVGTFVYKSQSYKAPYECQYVGIGSNGFVLPDPINVKSPELTIVNADEIKLTSGKDLGAMMNGSFTYYHIDVAAADVPAETVSTGVSGWPDAEWETPSAHLGDYVITKDGVVYEFKQSGNAYAWFLVADKYLISARNAALEIKEDYARLYQSSVVYSALTGKFTVGTSEVLTKDWLAQLYVSAAADDGRLITSASMSAYIKEDDDGYLSGVKIKADELIIDTYNFKIDADGNVSIKGEVTATSGSVGGFVIGSSNIKSSSGNKSLDLSYNGISFAYGTRTINVNDQGINSIGSGYQVRFGDYTSSFDTQNVGTIVDQRTSDKAKCALMLGASGSNVANYSIYAMNGCAKLGGLMLNIKRRNQEEYEVQQEDDFVVFRGSRINIPKSCNFDGKVLYIYAETNVTLKAIDGNIMPLLGSEGSSVRIERDTWKMYVYYGSWREVYSSKQPTTED